MTLERETSVAVYVADNATARDVVSRRGIHKHLL